MRSLPLLLVALLACSGSLRADEAHALFAEGQHAYVAGDTDTAKAKFALVLQLDPKHLAARNYLRMIEVQEARSGKGGALEKELNALILTKVEFREATFGTILDYLKSQAAKESDGNVKVNFVVQLPASFVASKTLTLSLANVPFTEVLRYLGDLAHVRFVIDKYAVIVRELEPEKAASSAQ
jgi:hypothetical protein